VEEAIQITRRSPDKQKKKKNATAKKIKPRIPHNIHFMAGQGHKKGEKGKTSN